MSYCSADYCTSTSRHRPLEQLKTKLCTRLQRQPRGEPACISKHKLTFTRASCQNCSCNDDAPWYRKRHAYLQPLRGWSRRHRISLMPIQSPTHSLSSVHTATVLTTGSPYRLSRSMKPSSTSESRILICRLSQSPHEILSIHLSIHRATPDRTKQPETRSLSAPQFSGKVPADNLTIILTTQLSPTIPRPLSASHYRFIVDSKKT
ncbi:hypothetical protein L873DRAFT_568099 [Choiromyces venosus 120613-1]|uniref:Uncharacterized protein n=1 Tax=Choiromyces venosus 120613-1 TaxID=1336337 RepID=A0A3N4JUD6_9PEZI|nr:hypothetical protein L873DRAFT_568099 [Choiromyces venosus 120613-1]